MWAVLRVAGRGQRGGRFTAFCSPSLPSCPSPKGPPSWGRAQETLLGFLAVGPAAPWVLTSPEGSESGTRGHPEAQRGKGGPSSPEPFSYDCLPSSQVGIGGPINLMISPLRPQEPPPPTHTHPVTLFSHFSLNLSVCCVACA